MSEKEKNNKDVIGKTFEIAAAFTIMVTIIPICWTLVLLYNSYFPSNFL